jgi:hypothetical protein
MPTAAIYRPKIGISQFMDTGTFQDYSKCDLDNRHWMSPFEDKSKVGLALGICIKK